METKIRKEDIIPVIPSQMFGIDKNIIVIFLIVAVLIIFSYYLFNGLKKLRDDVRLMKSKELNNEDVLEKVEINNDSVKAMELKMNQLVSELNKREQKEQSCPVITQPKLPVVQIKYEKKNEILGSDDEYSEDDTDEEIIPVVKV